MQKEAEVQSKSGAWYLMRIRPYRTMENAIEGAVLTFVDISERKRAERQLRESESRFHAIFNQAFAGVAQTDLSGQFTFVNDRFCEMLGYSREELLRARMIDITHPDDRSRATVLMDSLAGGGSDFSVERRYLRRDGAVVWVADRVSGIREGQNVTSLVTVSFDLSHRKRLEAEVASVDAHLTEELDALARLETVRSLRMTPSNRQAVLDELLGTALAINQADMGMLQLGDNDGERLTVVAQRGFDKPSLESLNGGGPDPGADAALRSREQVTVEDVAGSPLFADSTALDRHVAAGVRALQSVPLVTRQGKVIGVLTTHFRAPHRPDARKVRLFDLIGREVAEIVRRGMTDGAAGRGRPDDVG
jgi:PAS domain S-box-containing protein